jgi:hypothetical protein
VSGIKVGVETKRAEMSVIKRQGIAVLTEVSRVLVDGRNALDIRAAVAQRVAQRPCCTTVSDESRPKAGDAEYKQSGVCHRERRFSQNEPRP